METPGCGLQKKNLLRIKLIFFNVQLPQIILCDNLVTIIIWSINPLINIHVILLWPIQNCIIFLYFGVLGDPNAYLCTKRLLSRYASAVLSWYEYKMRLAKSRLYFLTWRNDRNYGEPGEKNHREKGYEGESNDFNHEKTRREMVREVRKSE